jgi:hypothetical protein
MRCAVRLTRHEISPRFAMRILSKSGRAAAAGAEEAEAEAEAAEEEDDGEEEEEDDGEEDGGWPPCAGADEEVEAGAAPTAGRIGGWGLETDCVRTE